MNLDGKEKKFLTSTLAITTIPYYNFTPLRIIRKFHEQNTPDLFEKLLHTEMEEEILKSAK